MYKNLSKNLSAIAIEGNLITLDLTQDFVVEDVKGQKAVDFGLAKTARLEDEIALAWGEVKDHWRIFQRRLEQSDPQDSLTTLTRERWVLPILELLGYQPVYQAQSEMIDQRSFAISHRAEAGENKPPIHIVSCRVELEKRQVKGNLSAHTLLQEYLNKTEHLWGIVTNGYRWRLLRDSSLMTRLSYIEFDLEMILNGENFADFSIFYRLFHRSRLPLGIDDCDHCLLEYYHQEVIQQGGRVRDKLRDGVEEALQILGNGFLQHPNNEVLRASLTDNSLNTENFYRQLLLLIYRLLFLMVAEGRDILQDGDDLEKVRIYREYYSIERLRLLAERPTYRREGFQDLWQGLLVTFQLFDENWRGKLLGLSPLNGDLFGVNTLQNLQNLALDNHDLLLAIRHLSLYESDKGKGLRRVNYGALDVEELGSVYESLLDFYPQVQSNTVGYSFVLVVGSDRKTTGSYYTPKELVAQLIKSALEPVIVARLAEVKGQGDDLRLAKEEVLLGLRVCDPACGSGHFLLAVARRIGKELALVRCDGGEPTPDELRLAIRDVIQGCIYGVDLNPLAVDLCKVALWIEGFCRGLPLNFLDHRIKCGNSLVGVLDLDDLNEGIPDNAFKAVTGDDKGLATLLKKRNKKENDSNSEQLPLMFENSLDNERVEYVEFWQGLGKIREDSTDEVKRKQLEYETLHSENNRSWWRDFSACNLWTVAFFMVMSEDNLQLFPTSEALKNLLAGRGVTEELVRRANSLGREKRFFHWPLEFPEVFPTGENSSVNRGFDCILGNPPWERIKLQEKEFFASKDQSIANEKNSDKRKKLIKELPKKNPQLAQDFEDAKHDAEGQSKFIRESGRFPLTAVGDINTYAIFAELVREIINDQGRCGVIVPTGIATDDTTKKFFGDLIQKQSLASLYDFENKEKLFVDVLGHYRFTILVMRRGQLIPAISEETKFAFFLTNPKQLENKQRIFTLASQDIALINPNTLTCPVFRTRSDAELTRKIYQNVPVLENENTGKNYWGISFIRMFDMSNDSHLFKSKADNNLLPLYEAKMFHQFDHRWSSYDEKGNTNDISLDDKCNPNFFINPRYWVDKKQVDSKLENWRKNWLLSFRGINNVANQKIAVFSLLPKVAVGNSAPVIILQKNKANLVACLVANFSSLVFDFITRQKLGGTNFNFFIVKQLPVIPPENYSEENIEYISSRVLELVYTAYDMRPFAEDMGYKGEPFKWNENRRAKIRAELDAKFAQLYGLTRDELRYILDPADVYGPDFPSETFRVLKNNEMKKYGEYRTQKLVLAAWDMMD